MKKGTTHICLVILACVTSSGATDCYHLGIPWCGVMWSCGNNGHYMRTDFSRSSCLLQPTSYCCPLSRDGSQDVILCEDQDFGGDCITVSLRQGQACQSVDDGKNDWASSVNTLGHCVRLYEDGNCAGNSKAYYPDNDAHNNLQEMNDRVSSVGRCFSHDQPTAGCDRAKRQAGPNRCQFAMDVLTVGFLAWRVRNQIQDPNSAMRWYQTGHNGRVESMEAVIERHHLNTGTGTNTAARNYARRMGNNNDDAGHILASRLGGSGTDLYNIFPQSLNINRGVWSDAEADVAALVNEHGRIRYNVNLEYGSPDDTRPFKIVYRVANADTGYVYFINDLVNP